MPPIVTNSEWGKQVLVDLLIGGGRVAQESTHLTVHNGQSNTELGRVVRKHDDLVLVRHRVPEKTDGKNEIGEEEREGPGRGAQLGPRPQVVEELHASDGTPHGETYQQHVDECQVRHRSTEARIDVRVDAHCDRQPEDAETTTERTQAKRPSVQHLQPPQNAEPSV